VDDFLLRVIAAALGIAIVAGPLGCFVVWRRIAYFGDAMAHAAILGVALSLAFDISTILGVLAVTAAVAVGISAMSRRSLGIDTLLGIAAHGSLALGIVAVSLAASRPVDLEAYLFGDLLAVNGRDLVLIWTGAILVLGLILWRWSALLMATLNPDLAHAYGISPGRENLGLMIALAVVVAVSIQVVGALLITAMLIIPAATARLLSRTPEQMALGACAAGVLAAISGLAVSWTLDTPTGPTIVSLTFAIFLLSAGIAGIWRRHSG